MARPRKEINWKLVEGKMAAGCSAEEIYNDPDTLMDQDTFYRRFREEYGVGFADYAVKFHSNGKGNVRYTQYAKAIQGNIPMLLLLGKHWLGQKDKDDPIENLSPELLQQTLTLLDQITKAQSARKIDDSNSNNETKS